MKKITEKISGEVFILASCAGWGLFPILTNFGAKRMPPIWYAAVISLLSAVFLFFYLATHKGLRELFVKKVWPWILGVTLFIVIIPNFLIFTSAKYTSGINTAMLLQTEVIFTFLFCWIFLGEKITRKKIIGAFIVFIGTMAILYQGKFELNIGDLGIIAATTLYPLGNFCAKKALKMVSPATILFVRQFLGGMTLLSLSFVLENWSQTDLLFRQNAGIILVNGIFIMAISRIWWYEGLKRVSLSTVASLSSAPAFSLLFAVFFFSEIPTLYQLAGFVIVMAGLLVLTRSKHAIP
ncbi:DMT family transporter [Candidatus Peregrinibacteria bacterium]|nr:DMT family transporter [Candidatus Peregrinibacteria bacterium]